MSNNKRPVCPDCMMVCKEDDSFVFFDAGTRLGGNRWKCTGCQRTDFLTLDMGYEYGSGKEKDDDDVVLKGWWS